MHLTNFLAELRRRDVYKVAVAYAVVAWLLIQAGSILVSNLRSADLGDEGVCYCGHLGISGRANFCLGV